MQFLIVVLVLILTLPALVLLRMIMSWRIKKLMFRKSKKVSANSSALEETPEVPAGSPLTVVEFNSDSIPEAANTARRNAAREAVSLFRWLWVNETAACIAYLGAGALAGFSSATFESAAILAGGYFSIISLRLLIYSNIYSKVRGQRVFERTRRIIGTIILGPFRLIFGVSTQWVAFSAVIIAAAVVAMISESMGAAITLWLAILFHVALRIRIYRRSQDGENHSLLMLRVFGMDKSAFMTFGYMLDYWRRLGSSFTVVDPSYFRYQHRALSSRNLSIVFWLVTIATFFQAELTETFVTVGATDAAEVAAAQTLAMAMIVIGLSLFIMLGYFIYTLVLFAKIPRSFASSDTHISKRISLLLQHPRTLKLEFRSLHMYCFDNTWKLAVSAFVKSADVVLMDLRGYTEQRKGCGYEVDFIFDSIHINRIVFLVDRESDLEEVRKLVLERWEHLKVDSPNLTLENPVAKIYVSEDQTAKDVRGLLNLLYVGEASVESLGTTTA